jgi:enoyl-CoA hydratase/carnithine racemase
VRQLTVPVIARIPGWCLGGGLEFALACDLRVGSDQAKLGMPEVKVGIPSIIHAALLPRLVGQARANWMLLTGEVVDAREALSYGLLDRVVPAEELDEEVDRVARLLAGFGPSVLAQQKRLLREWESEPLETSILNGVPEFAKAFETGEPQRYMDEFVRAKQKKR